MRSSFFIPAILPLLLVSCSTTKDVRETSPQRRAGTALALTEDRTPRPYWIDKSPSAGGTRFFLGESHGSETREEGLEKAWISAFVRIGMTEFPELSKITSRSVENLKGSTYERRFSLRLERIDWAGVKEARELGSPFVERDPDTKKISVYRLVKWSDRDIASAKKQISSARQFQLPSSPEAKLYNEERLIGAVRAIQSVNSKVGKRNEMLAKVLGEVKCGVTLDDLLAVLGPPDRTNPYNSAFSEKEYYWGQFKVARAAGDPSIATISRDDDESGERRIVCPNRLKND